jgi:hypothetical protein
VTDATATIPEERFQQEVERRKAAERQAAEAAESHAALTAQVAELTARVEASSTLQAQLDVATRSAQTQAHHVGMLENGVRTQSVRDFMLHQHQQHAEQAGAEAQTWDSWFTTNKDRMIQDLSSLRPPEPVAAAPTATTPALEQPSAPAPVPVPAPQANNGAQPTPPPTQSYVPGSISGLAMDEWKANKGELMQGLVLPWSS